MTLKLLVIFVFYIRLLVINSIIYLKNSLSGNSQLNFNFLLKLCYMAWSRRCLSFLLYLHKKNNKNVKRRWQKWKTKNKKRNKHTFHMKLNPMISYLHPNPQRHKCIFHLGDSNTLVNFDKKYYIFQILKITNEFMDNEM